MHPEITEIKTRLSLTSKVNTVVALAEEEIRRQTGLRLRLIVMGEAPPQDMDAIGMANLIAQAIGMYPGDLHVKSRKEVYTQLRYLVMYFVKEYFPKMTLKDIGSLFGSGMDHTSVITGIASAKNLIDTNDVVFHEKYELALQAITQCGTESN